MQFYSQTVSPGTGVFTSPFLRDNRPGPVNGVVNNTSSVALTFIHLPEHGYITCPANTVTSFSNVRCAYFQMTGTGTASVALSWPEFPVPAQVVASITGTVTATISGTVTASVSNTVAITASQLNGVPFLNGNVPVSTGWIHFVLEGSGSVPTVTVGGTTYSLNGGAQLSSPVIIADDYPVDGTAAITFAGATVVTLVFTAGVD